MPRRQQRWVQFDEELSTPTTPNSLNSEHQGKLKHGLRATKTKSKCF